VEQIDENKSWFFNPEAKDWQALSEPPVEKLRRQATEATLLLAEFPPFLRCNNPEDVSNACQVMIPRLNAGALAQVYGPYQFAGLARLQQRSDGKSFKF